MGDVSIGTEISSPMDGIYGISTVGLDTPGTTGLSNDDFLPTDDPGNVLWLDAADTQEIIQLNNFASPWNDKSGNSEDATQGTGANQPATNTRTINQYNTLDFDGSNDLMDGTVLDLSTGAFSIACVFAVDSVTGDQALFSIFGGGAQSRIRFETSGTGMLVAACSSNLDQAARITSAALSISTPVLITAVFNPSVPPTHTDIKIFMNGTRIDNAGVDLGTPATLTATTDTYETASRTGGTLTNGTIGEIVIANTTWTDEIRINHERYLLDKWI